MWSRFSFLSCRNLINNWCQGCYQHASRWDYLQEPELLQPLAPIHAWKLLTVQMCYPWQLSRYGFNAETVTFLSTFFSPRNVLVCFKAGLMWLKLSEFSFQLSFLFCGQQILKKTHPSGPHLIRSPDDDDSDKSDKRLLFFSPILGSTLCQMNQVGFNWKCGIYWNYYLNHGIFKQTKACPIFVFNMVLMFI